LEGEVKVSGCLSSKGQAPLEEQGSRGQDLLEVTRRQGQGSLEVTGSWQRSLGGHWKLAEVIRWSLEVGKDH
jgi:hypothetical protein